MKLSPVEAVEVKSSDEDELEHRTRGYQVRSSGLRQYGRSMNVIKDMFIR